MRVFVRLFHAASVAAILAVPAAVAHAEGDAAHGKQIFETCGICHSNQPGQVKLGPSLFGIVGRQAGSMPGFRYTPGVQKLSGDVTWTPEQIFKWLADPSKMAPGTAMSFNLPGEKDRADVIAYLATLK